jgi:hypothetical protein
MKKSTQIMKKCLVNWYLGSRTLEKASKIIGFGFFGRQTKLQEDIAKILWKSSRS